MNWLVLANDFGVPWHGTKGASIHLRSMAEALATGFDSVEVAVRRLGRPTAGNPGHGRVILTGLATTEPPTNPAFDPDRMNAELLAWILERHRHSPFDAIYERYALWTVAGLDAARKLGIPHLLEVNAPLVDEASRWRNLELTVTARAAEHRLAMDGDHLLAVSSPIARHLLRLGANPDRIHVEGNGVADAFLRVERRREAGTSPFVVGFAGSLKPWHGLSTLVSAFDRLGGAASGWRLRIVGAGPMAEWLRAAAETREGVVLTGPMPHESIPCELARMDAGAALYEEVGEGYFSPLKVAEYQAAGLPVVASGGAGVREMITHGNDGLLIQEGDVAGAATAFERIRFESNLSATLAAAGRCRAAARTWSAIAARCRTLASGQSPCAEIGR